MTPYSTDELLAFALAVSFAAGLNAYAVLATVGLLARFGAIALPPALSAVDNWWVLGSVLVLLTIDFLADKTPLVDLVWNVVQPVVRVPVAALLAFGAAAQLSLELQLAVALVGGVIALLSSGTKLALRTLVNGSPEPVSNAGVGLAEDTVAVGLTWTALTFPWVAASITLLLLAICAVFARVAVQALLRLVRRPSERRESSAS